MKSSSAMLPIFEIGTRLPYGPDTRGVLQRCFYAWNSSYLPHFFVDPLYMHKPKPPEPTSPCFSMLSLFKGLHVRRVLDFTLQGCLNKRLSGCAKDVHACRNFSRMFQKTCTLAQTLFGRRNVPAGLQELCSDVSKGMQSWKNFVPTAKCFLTSRSRSGSAPQVSCTCPDQCLPVRRARNARKHPQAATTPPDDGCLHGRGRRGILDALIESDLAIANADDAVGVRRNVAFMRHQDDGVALGVKFVEKLHDVHAGLRVEVSGRLVRQDDRRGVDQGERNRHALPLTSGQFIRLVVHAVGKLHHRERFLRALRALLRSHAAVNQRQLDIVQSGGAG